MVQIVVVMFSLVMALAYPVKAESQEVTPPTTKVVEEDLDAILDGPENETVEQKLKRLEEWKKARKARMERLVKEQIPVVIDGEKQDSILADSIKIEVGEAEEKAEDSVSRYDTPAMRKVRKDRERAEKNARDAEKYAFESKRNTGLRCLNQKDYNNVVVHPGSSKRYAVRSHSTMFIRNTLNVPVDIMFASGSEDPIAVEQLCPGGSISIQKPLDTFLVGDMMVVSYTASVPGKELMYPTSPAIMVMACRHNGCQREFFATWEIRSR